VPAQSEIADYTWLRQGSTALEAMLHAIGHARSSVCMESYIWENDRTGLRFREALCAAAQRGCKVRVLVDAFGSLTLPSSFWECLLQAGGEFRWFNPLTLSRSMFRNHRKLLVTDGQTAFIGGFNIADVWDGDGVQEGWRDLGLQIHGAIAPLLLKSFDHIYELAAFRHQRFMRLRRPPNTARLESPEGELLLSGPGRGFNPFNRALHRDLQHAGKVRFIAAYFLPPWRLRRDLMLAAQRGRTVQLILAGKSDVPLMRLATRCLYQRLLRAGVEIYEYQPQILHSKLALLDDILYVGSANMDVRSFHINYELVLRRRDPPLAELGHQLFDQDLRHCARIQADTWKATRNFWDRWMERSAYYLLARIDPYVARWQWQALR